MDHPHGPPRLSAPHFSREPVLLDPSPKNAAKPAPKSPVPGQVAAKGTGRIAAFRLASYRGSTGGRIMAPASRAAFAKALASASPADCWDAMRHQRSAEGVRHQHYAFDDAEIDRRIAKWLGVPFMEQLPEHLAATLHPPRFNRSGAVFQAKEPGGVGAVAPDPSWLPMMAAALVRSPAIADTLVIVPFAEAIRRRTCAGPVTVEARMDPIHAIPTERTARETITGMQGIVMGACAGACAVGTMLLPSLVGITLLALLTIVLVGYAGSRAMALLDRKRQEPSVSGKPGRLPVYSILVPLYREATAVPELVQALRRLDYPTAKLDVMFLTEAEDVKTREAIAKAAHDWPCRVIVLPKGHPKTKPRALNAGLRQAAGSLITIFDAEDRPDPGQLRAAVAAFQDGPENLAALQARLTIDHQKHSWLSRQFAIEYGCLFNYIMPMVTRRGGLVLLGGTSNHFKRDALLAVGGWDPFNVTEDADLAVRLRREGYRVQMLNSDTFEEAPITISAWLKQRSRWFKGYMQTLLVHSRNPRLFVKEAGISDAALMYLFIIGALGAAVAHLVITAQLSLMAVGVLPASVGVHPIVMALQLSAISFGYGANVVLGAVSAKEHAPHRISPLVVVWFPIYWLLMGAAVLMALYDLSHKPHHWRKTEHGLASRPRRSRTA